MSKYRVVIIDEDGDVYEQGIHETKEAAFEHRAELIKNFEYVSVHEVKP